MEYIIHNTNLNNRYEVELSDMTELSWFEKLCMLYQTNMQLNKLVLIISSHNIFDFIDNLKKFWVGPTP